MQLATCGWRLAGKKGNWQLDSGDWQTEMKVAAGFWSLANRAKNRYSIPMLLPS